MEKKEKTELWEPIIFDVLEHRDEKRPEGKTWAPIYFPLEMGEQVPSGQVGYFDLLCQPTQDIEQAAFIVHPAGLPGPTGYTPVFGQPEASIETWNRLVTTGFTGDTRAEGLPLTPTALQMTRASQDDESDDDVQELVRDADGYAIFVPKSGRIVKATNFHIDVVAVSHLLGQDWQAEKRSLKLRVTLFTSVRQCQEIELSYEKIDVVAQEIQKRIGEAVIYPRGRKAFLAQIGVEIRQNMVSCRHLYVYTVSGWVHTPQGQIVYARDNAIPPDANLVYRSGFRFGRTVNPVTRRQLAENAHRLLGLSRQTEAALLPFLFAHLGLMWSLFEEAGYPPHLLLFIKGTTGSLKTAVASLLFNFSGERENNIPASFRDTSASMEVRMGQYKDRVLLVDDFCPAASDGMKKQLDASLEQLVRFYGDGVAKSRTNPRLEEVYDKRPHGLCVITGEDTSGSYSSRLRCLFLNVAPDTYDKGLLASFQADPTAWTEYLESFVTFCEQNVPKILALIKAEYPALRQLGEKYIGERRLVDAFASLALALRITLGYLGECLGAEPESQEEQYKVFLNVILGVCKQSADEAKAADPVKTFVRLLHEGVSEKTIAVGTRAEFAVAPDQFIGFLEKGYCYCWPSRLYDFVRKSYAASGKSFPLSMNQLWEALYVAGVLVPEHRRDESGRKFEYGVRLSFGDRPRMLRLDPSQFEMYL